MTIAASFAGPQCPQMSGTYQKVAKQADNRRARVHVGGLTCRKSPGLDSAKGSNLHRSSLKRQHQMHLHAVCHATQIVLPCSKSGAEVDSRMPYGKQGRAVTCRSCRGSACYCISLLTDHCTTLC